MWGYCHPLSKLYMIPLYQDLNQVPRVTPQPAPRVESPVLFSAYEVQSVKSLINFLHKTCLSLPISVWLKATQRNYLATFPGLSVKRIRKYCTKKLQTALGHMRLILSNVRSTQPHKRRSKKHDVGVFVTDEDEMKNLIAMDFAGCYPVTSKRGHKYIFIMYDFDSNYINAVPVKSRKTNIYIAAFQLCYDDLRSRGFIAQLL